MSGHRHVGGTRGWKAHRAECGACGRDVATSPDVRGRSRSGLLYRTHKATPGGTRCTWSGADVPTGEAYHPERPEGRPAGTFAERRSARTKAILAEATAALKAILHRMEPCPCFHIDMDETGDCTCGHTPEGHGEDNACTAEVAP